MTYKIFLAFFTIWPFLLFAGDTIDIDFDSLINEIRYEYELYPNHSPEFMCMGTLYVGINIPDETNEVVFCHTQSNRYPPTVFYSRPLDISGKSSVETTIDRVKAHTYFRVVFYINGIAYRTSDLAVDDYIAPEDLEYLKTLEDPNAIDDVSVNEPVIEVYDRTISIKTDSVLILTIRTIDGKTVIIDRIDQSVQIPLDSGIYILTYHYDNHSNTKKIIIK